jgi:hypothetical protein
MSRARFPIILRPGDVTAEEIMSVIGPVSCGSGAGGRGDTPLSRHEKPSLRTADTGLLPSCVTMPVPDDASAGLNQSGTSVPRCCRDRNGDAGAAGLPEGGGC